MDPEIIKNNEVVIKLIKTCIDKRGSLSHYGHFIHDFIVPIIHHIKNKKYTHIYLEIHNKWCNLGSFINKAEQILGLKITQLNSDEINLLSYPKIILPTLSFGPYKSMLFKDIVPYVKNTLDISESPYKVILIERGFEIKGSGGHRRHLDNHNHLKNTLSKHYGSLFKNVILEKLSIDEQVSLFVNAQIVIGQHGAGLCNIVWMTNPDSLVIEFPPYAVDTFMNMCSAKKFKYIRIESNPKRVIEVCSKMMSNIKIALEDSSVSTPTVESNDSTNNYITSNEIIIKMIKTYNRNGGCLRTYGHFIHDFIVPIIYHIKNKKYNHIYLEIHKPWCNLGNLINKAEQILGLKITQLSSDDINLLSYPKIILASLSFGPYNPILFKDIIPYVKNTLNISESPYKIILIERGFGIKGSGAYRRYLDNHNDLKNTLTGHYGPLFRNVILEDLSIDEQVSLFLNAQIVIGQHGAGLCNIIWMTNPESLVIEFPPYREDTFMNMCSAKEIKYVRIEPNPKRVIEVCSIRISSIKSIDKELQDSRIIINDIDRFDELLNNRGVLTGLRGGLGSQLFIISTGYVTSIKYNIPFYILKNNWKSRHSSINYDNIFKNFGIFKDNIIINRNVDNNIGNFLVDNKYERINTSDDFGKPNIINYSNGLILCGFYQNYEYIKDYEKDINILLIKDLDSNLSLMRTKYATENTAFIHIRCRNGLKNIFKQPSIDYYKNCVIELKKINPTVSKIFIFTNDIDFVKSKAYFNDTLFQLIDESNELDALALMSLCNAGSIITNSTFGWWGAFLGSHQAKNPVFVLNNWRIDRATPELYPETWIKV